MSSKTKDGAVEQKEIPEVIKDESRSSQTKKYERGRFLGKVIIKFI